jgi:hypothetical protein
MRSTVLTVVPCSSKRYATRRRDSLSPHETEGYAGFTGRAKASSQGTLLIISAPLTIISAIIHLLALASTSAGGAKTLVQRGVRGVITRCWTGCSLASFELVNATLEYSCPASVIADDPHVTTSRFSLYPPRTVFMRLQILCCSWEYIMVLAIPRRKDLHQLMATPSLLLLCTSNIAGQAPELCAPGGIVGYKIGLLDMGIS